MSEMIANSSMLATNVLVNEPELGTRSSENACQFMIKFIYRMNGWQVVASILAILIEYDQCMLFLAKISSAVD